MIGQIFISYHRDDASIVGRLYERLVEHFPQNKTLMNVDREKPTKDFGKTIEETIGYFDVLIAVIGKGWLTSCVESPDDYVRLQLATAFQRNIGVIAVLVEGASMPRFDDLPDDLKALARLNALQLSDTSFDADYQRLVSAIASEKLTRRQRIYVFQDWSRFIARELKELERLGGKRPEAHDLAAIFDEAARINAFLLERWSLRQFTTRELKELERLGKERPEAYDLAIIFDEALRIRASLSERLSMSLFMARELKELERLEKERPEAHDSAAIFIFYDSYEAVEIRESLLKRWSLSLFTFRELKELERLGKERPDVKYFSGGPQLPALGSVDESEKLASILASGNFPKEAEHRTTNVPGKPERSPVDCTVFAPDRVERKQTRLLQVFLHSPEARRQAETTARKCDPEAKERGHRSLVLDVPIGTTFAFDVEIEGFVFPERTDTLLWTGQPQAATFQFDVPKGCKLGQHAGTVRISQDGMPVGRITFQIEVVLDARDARERPVGKEARHYHACFCSYSSLDRAEMLKRAQGLRATGLETFIDVLALRPGDMWNPKIFEAIDESDLFVVIWSTNARDSEWVKKESHYALRHYKEHGSPDFVPIPVEGPPIASVPQDLQAYHFNDELLGQIRAAELEMLARKHLGQSNVTPVTSES